MGLTQTARSLAWAVGLAGALACVVAGTFNAVLGLSDQLVTLILGSLFGVLMGVLGALIATREPRNSIGWLMCLTALAASFVNLPVDYAYAAFVIHHGSWPLATEILWLATWLSIPVFGLFLPFILARFPDGTVPPRWRIADWLAIAGTVAFVASIALAPGDTPLASPRVDSVLAPYARNALGLSLPAGLLAYLWMGGLATIIAAYVASAGSLAARFRRASPDESLQLKWFAYSGILIAVTVIYAGVAWDLGQDLGQALIPFEVTVVTLPLTIAIGILRYRLFDIDLIINRSLVYGGLTAILGALYAAIVTFLNRFFISATGQRSDAAYVLTAFAVVVAFGPLKDWLQRRVDRRLGGGMPTQVLERFKARINAVVSVLDTRKIAADLVDEAVTAFNARGGAVYLASGDPLNPYYSRGRANGEAVVEVDLRHNGTSVGRLVLTSRRGDVGYSEHDREALQQSADTVGDALALAARLGNRT